MVCIRSPRSQSAFQFSGRKLSSRYVNLRPKRKTILDLKIDFWSHFGIFFSRVCEIQLNLQLLRVVQIVKHCFHLYDNSLLIKTI